MSRLPGRRALVAAARVLCRGPGGRRPRAGRRRRRRSGGRRRGRRRHARLHPRHRRRAVDAHAGTAPSWSGWSSLGGVLTSGPAASARPNGDLRRLRARHGRTPTTTGPSRRPAAGPTWAPLGGAFLSASGRDLPPGDGRDRRRRRRHGPQLYHAFYAGRLVGLGAARRRRQRQPEHHLARPGDARHLRPRSADDQLYQKSWTPGVGLGRVPSARRQADLRHRCHGVGRQPARRLRPRHRRRGSAIRSWTNTGGWVALGAPRRPVRPPAPARPSTAPNRLAVFARERPARHRPTASRAPGPAGRTSATRRSSPRRPRRPRRPPTAVRAAPASRFRLHPGRRPRAGQRQRPQARRPQEAADHQGPLLRRPRQAQAHATARSRTRRASA